MSSKLAPLWGMEIVPYDETKYYPLSRGENIIVIIGWWSWGRKYTNVKIQLSLDSYKAGSAVTSALPPLLHPIHFLGDGGLSPLRPRLCVDTGKTRPLGVSEQGLQSQTGSKGTHVRKKGTYYLATRLVHKVGKL